MTNQRRSQVISGAHAIIYSADPKADRQFFRDLLHLPHVDVGEGWLIFGLPPSELAVHPAETSGAQEIYLLCDQIQAFLQEMEKRGISCAPIQSQRWGLLTYVTLPGGGRLGIYEPRHARPKPMKFVSGSRRLQKAPLHPSRMPGNKSRRKQ